MKSQALFSSKDKSKILKCRLLQFLFGALRVKMYRYMDMFYAIFSKEETFMTSCLLSWVRKFFKKGLTLKAKNLLPYS